MADPDPWVDARHQRERAQWWQEEAEARAREVDRIVAVIDKCRQSAGLEPSPDGPTGDVTNLLHRGDVAKRGGSDAE